MLISRDLSEKITPNEFLSQARQDLLTSKYWVHSLFTNMYEEAADYRLCLDFHTLNKSSLSISSSVKSSPSFRLVVLDICHEFSLPMIFFFISSVSTLKHRQQKNNPIINVTTITFIIFRILTICYHAIVFTDSFIILGLIALALAVKNIFF